MKWSFRVARVFGIDVRIHATLALAVLYLATALEPERGLRGLAFGGVLVCGLFICLTLHELGHCLAARHFGVSVSEISLLPMGGVARLASVPRRAQQELWIALAGPCVNAVIACALLVALGRAQVPLGLSDLGQLAAPSLPGLGRSLFWGNLVLGLFNLLPGLPMDGGHAFRALLSSVIDRARATRIAAGVGQALAFGLVALAIGKDWGPLGLVGLFVFVEAGRERVAARAAELLRELRAGEVCDPHAVVFAPEAVFHGKDLVGTLARDQALTFGPRLGLRANVSSLMRREFFAVDAGTPLDEVRRRLLELAGRPVVVRSLTGYAGVLGSEDLERITLVAERLAQAGIRRPQPVPDPALH